MKRLLAIACFLGLSTQALADTPDTSVRMGGEQPDSSNFYPDDSIRVGEQGHAVVQVTISATGKPENVKILQSSGFKRLDQYGLMWMNDIRWQPATHNGKPYAVTLHVPITWWLTVGTMLDGHQGIDAHAELK
jgi:TonB family protein